MIQIAYFDKDKDIQETRLGLSIDLSRAIREGVVKDSGTEPEYNNIEDPNKVRGRVSDVFAAINERNAALNRAAAPAAAPNSEDNE